MKEFNDVRNMSVILEPKGKKVSVMGSGMGMPSIESILMNYIQNIVEAIIRIGSAGSYSEKQTYMMLSL